MCVCVFMHINVLWVWIAWDKAILLFMGRDSAIEAYNSANVRNLAVYIQMQTLKGIQHD